MGGSWKIGRLAGIDIFVHWTFLLLIGGVFFSSLVGSQSAFSALGSVFFIVSLFGCVVLHELGHALMARRFGIGTKDITLLPIGGVARLERMPKNPVQELLVAIAGPAVNVVIAGVLFVVLLLSGGLFQFALVEATQTSFLAQLLMVNVSLVLFNMLPAFPMDGGRVLRAFLAMFLPYAQATRWAARVGQVMAGLFVLAGLFSGAWMLALVGLFIFFGARGEARQAELEASAEGVPVHAAMATRFYTLDVRAPLEEASYLSRSGQGDFPVLDGDKLVGMLYAGDLESALARGEARSVGEIARREVPVIKAYDSLSDALTAFASTNLSALPVVNQGRLVGVLTPGSVHWWLKVRDKERPQADFWPRRYMPRAG